jgi:hypothetical protein
MTEPSNPFDEWLTRQPVEPLTPPPGVFDRIDRSASRRRWARAAGTGATVLVLILGVAGVIRGLPGSDRSADPQPTVRVGSSSAPPSTTRTDPSTPQPASEPPPTAQNPPPQTSTSTRCIAAQLQINVSPGTNAAGHIGLIIVFTNTSTRACTMYGYPGVSFVTGPTGSQINEPAQRSPAQGSPTLVPLPPGGKAHASLLLVNVANYPTNTCKPVQAAGLRVYPPDDTTALYTSSPQQICTTNGTGTAQIYPIQTGASAP